MTEPRATETRLWLAVALLVAAHAALAFTAVRTKGVTYDEVYHVTGGYLFDRFNEFRVHTDNGVLPQRLHGLAPLVAGATPPRMDDVYWRTSDAGVIAHHFFYGVGNDSDAWLLGARALNLLFSAGVCVLAFVWARALGGALAGLAACALLAFSPTLLAHGPLATTDAASALLLPASVGLFWWQLQRRDAGAVAASALVFALACVTKYSALILLPVFVVLATVHHFVVARRGLGAWLAVTLAHAGAAWVVIWACFGFRYGAFAPGLPPGESLIRPWPWLLERLGWQASVIDFAREWKLLPEGFLFGYANTAVGAQGRGAFLAGAHSVTGWREFFPLAFLWKSSLAELLAAAVTLLGVGVALARRRLSLAWLPLAIFATAYGAAAISSHLNIGQRHLLPLYPLLAIAAGVTLAAWPRRAWLAATVVVVAQAATALTTWPHYLAYFNPVAGGPANGWRLLVDSSLDWGQDLPALRRWLDANNSGPGAGRVHLAYFGSGDARRAGIRAVTLPGVDSFKILEPRPEFSPGLYAISATILQRVYSPVAGPWTLEREKALHALRARAPTELSDTDARLLDALRLARLCHALRERAPDAQVGYSILIYRVDATELRAALGEP